MVSVVGVEREVLQSIADAGDCTAFALAKRLNIEPRYARLICRRLLRTSCIAQQPGSHRFGLTPTGKDVAGKFRK